MGFRSPTSPRGRLRSEAEVIAAFQPLAAIVDNDSSQTQRRDHVRQPLTFRRPPRPDDLAPVPPAKPGGRLALRCPGSRLCQRVRPEPGRSIEPQLRADDRHRHIKRLPDLRIERSAVQDPGGNHQIVAALATAVADRIVLGHRLEALARKRTGEYVLTFEPTHGGNRQVVADFVVLCLPFTILRNIDVRVPLPPIKQKAIQELGYGVDAKLILGFQSRVWRAAGFRWRFICRLAVPVGLGQQPRATQFIWGVHDLSGRKPGAGARDRFAKSAGPAAAAWTRSGLSGQPAAVAWHGDSGVLAVKPVHSRELRGLPARSMDQYPRRRGDDGGKPLLRWANTPASTGKAT